MCKPPHQRLAHNYSSKILTAEILVLGLSFESMTSRVAFFKQIGKIQEPFQHTMLSYFCNGKLLNKCVCRSKTQVVEVYSYTWSQEAIHDAVAQTCMLTPVNWIPCWISSHSPGNLDRTFIFVCEMILHALLYFTSVQQFIITKIIQD